MKSWGHLRDKLAGVEIKPVEARADMSARELADLDIEPAHAKAELARRERLANGPKYRALLDAAIARAKGGRL